MSSQPTPRDIGELTFGKRRVPLPPEEGVIGAQTAAVAVDRRQPINAQDIRRSPWRKICDLLITANDGSPHTGTAWFISPRTLVTAGHCLFVNNPQSTIHGMVRSIRVMPARNGETEASQSLFGWAEVTRQDLLVHPRWIGGDRNFDYGVINLPETQPALGAITGTFAYAHFKDADLDESRPTLSGYPDDVVEGTQWVEVNRIRKVESHRVFYTINTERGQSGSPVFFTNGNEDVACAIHHWGEPDFNIGVRINPSVIAQLNEWRVG